MKRSLSFRAFEIVRIVSMFVADLKTVDKAIAFCIRLVAIADVFNAAQTGLNV